MPPEPPIDAGVRAVVEGGALEPDAVAVIDGWLGAAWTRPALELGPDGRPALGERAPADPPPASSTARPRPPCGNAAKARRHRARAAAASILSPLPDRKARSAHE
jgi:hypothetical protein